ncbi:MAG: hypothetical protein C4321_08075 [Chloroflexota bacterium]
MGIERWQLRRALFSGGAHLFIDFNDAVSGSGFSERGKRGTCILFISDIVFYAIALTYLCSSQRSGDNDAGEQGTEYDGDEQGGPFLVTLS